VTIERPRGAATWFLAALLLITVAATSYEVLNAVGVLTPGPDPGEAPPGEGIVVLAGSLALVAGAVASFAFVLSQPRPAERLVPPLVLAGAGFALARFYAYVPYYAPTLRRASEGGLISGWWMAALVVLTIGTAALTWSRWRPGLYLSAVTLFVTAVTAFAAHGGQ